MATEEVLPDDVSIGAALRHVRTAAGLSAQEVAEALGWETSKMSLVEHGKQKLRILEVAQYATFLGYDLNEVWSLAATLAMFSRRSASEQIGWYGQMVENLQIRVRSPLPDLIGAAEMMADSGS